jgi:hypothetical protein
MHVKLFFLLFSLYPSRTEQNQDGRRRRRKKHETKKTFLIKKRNGMKAVF